MASEPARLPAAVALLLLLVCGCSAGPVDDCIPSIADTCFADVSQDWACISAGRTAPEDCAGRDVADFCRSLDDALNCTSDVIDGDCGASGGRSTFDGWLRGLRNVQRRLCDWPEDVTRKLLEQDGPCRVDLVACMERGVGVAHVTDLLRVRLDAPECRKVLQTATVCTKLPAHCIMFTRWGKYVSDLVTGFLVESPCAEVVWSAAPSAGRQVTTLSTGATVTIALLACLALVLVGALTVLTHRTSCFRIPLSR